MPAEAPRAEGEDGAGLRSHGRAEPVGERAGDLDVAPVDRDRAELAGPVAAERADDVEVIGHQPVEKLDIDRRCAKLLHAVQKRQDALARLHAQALDEGAGAVESGDIYEREVLHEAARVHLADRGPEVLADPLRRCERVSREIDHRGAGTAELDAVAAYRFRYRLRRGVDRVRVPAVGVTLGDAVEREQAGAGEDLGGGVDRRVGDALAQAFQRAVVADECARDAVDGGLAAIEAAML